MKFRLALFASVFAILFTHQAFSTHLRSGQIMVRQLSLGNMTCRITVRVWTNTNNTTVLFGGDQDWLNFGDGSPIFLIPEQPNTVIDQGNGIAYAEFQINHTYAGPGRYTVSYQEPNRNAGILNIQNSINTPFYLETTFRLDPFFPNAYSTPEFLTPTIFKASPSLGYSFSLAADDHNDFTLYYELAVPKQQRDQQVAGYMVPDNLTVNPHNGLITWDGKFQGLSKVGEFLIAVKVYQFYQGYIVGYVIRDVQIIVEDSPIGGEISDDLDPDPNGRVFVEENQTKEIQISVDSPGNGIKFEAFSSLGSDNYSFEATGGQDHTTGTLKLTSTSGIVRDNPYMITVRVIVVGASNIFTRDVNYLFYTKDIQPTEPDIVLGSEQAIDAKNIYPNPVRDFLQVDLAKTSNVTVAILNQQGVQVQLHSIAADNSVDLRALPSGIYICEVREGSSLIIRKRIVKE